METQEVTLHNELKHKSIFLRDFTTAAQMLRQVLRRCFGRCCDRAVSGVWRVGIVSLTLICIINPQFLL